MKADFVSLVEQAVRDDSGLLNPLDIDNAVNIAVIRYSQDRPQTIVADLTASGTDTLTLPIAWEPEFSSITSLEYPLGAFPPEMTEPDLYGLYQTPSATVLRMVYVPVDTVRMSYTRAHVVTETTDTIPTAHREAVSCWAAAYCCDQLASHYAGLSDSTIQADRSDRGGQSKDFAARAKALRARYLSELGLDEKKFTSAGVVVDLDINNSRGQDRFTHPNRYR